MLNTIRDLMDQQPFRSFRVVMTSGEHFDIHDPHLVALGETTVFYCYPLSDRWAWLRLNQIAHIEPLEQAA